MNRQIAIVLLCLLGLSTAFAGNIQPRSATTTAAAAPKINQDVRDVANLRADFSILQEENQKLALRIEELENSNRQLNKQIQELTELINALSEQVGGFDQKINNVSKSVESERQQRKSDMKNMADNVAKEMSRGGTSSKASEYTSYYEMEIKPGDTLSAIGQATGVPWKTIMEFNGMSSPNLRPGQVIKIPQK